MGLGLIGSSSSYDSSQERVVYIREKPYGNPNPANYIIIRHEEKNGNLLIEIQYADCSNYEGRKILLFKNCSLDKLKKQKLIDPHFSNNKKYHSPFARFEPTKEGWRVGFALLNFK